MSKTISARGLSFWEMIRSMMSTTELVPRTTMVLAVLPHESFSAGSCDLMVGPILIGDCCAPTEQALLAALLPGPETSSADPLGKRRITECPHEFACGLEAICREFLQRLEDRRVDVRGNVLALGRDRPRLLGTHTGCHLLGGRPREWRLADEHFVDDRRERVDVAPCREVHFTGRLFRAHVLRST